MLNAGAKTLAILNCLYFVARNVKVFFSRNVAKRDICK